MADNKKGGDRGNLVQNSLRQLASAQASYLNGKEKGLVNHDIRSIFRRG